MRKALSFAVRSEMKRVGRWMGATTPPHPGMLKGPNAPAGDCYPLTFPEALRELPCVPASHTPSLSETHTTREREPPAPNTHTVSRRAGPETGLMITE